VADRALVQRTPVAPDARGGLRLTPAERAIRALARRWHLGLLAAAALTFAVPVVELAHGTARARACVASYAAPRGPELPDCRQEIRWFVTPSRVPWTSTLARYRAEELLMRAAVAAYEDACVGRPDAAARSRAADDLGLAARVIRAGSQRITVEELGPAVGAPDPGRSALLAGDRRTLLGHADEWEHWSVRLRALEAALIEGDQGRAGALARRYAEFDPRDDDLRVAVASMLCLQGEAQRGVALLATVQAERARERHESWARNWGEIRALLVACAAKGGVPPPPLPERAEGGTGDPIEARAVLRLRLAGRTGPGDGAALRLAALEVIQMLKDNALPGGARVRVLAALLASGHPVDANLAAALATPHVDQGEAPPLSGPGGLASEPWTPGGNAGEPWTSRALTALEWLDEPRGVRPSPSRQALRHATDRLRRLAGSPELSAEERLSLDAAATATALEAVRAFALAGDAAGAVQIVDRMGARALPGAAARALARSSAWYVAGDPAAALGEIEQEPGDLRDDTALQAAWWIQKAELYASAGRRDEAARAAVTADDAAVRSGLRRLEVRAQWTLLALTRPPLSPLRAAPPAPIPDSHDGGRPPIPPGPRVWPWVGDVATASSWLAAGAESPAAVAQALGFWEAARRAPPAERRAIRHAAAAAHRGEQPEARTAYLALAAELLPPGEGDVEVWLDAFSATAARRLTLRAYAWARAEAARFRGDAEAAAEWTRRHRALVQMAAAPDDAELTAALGI
jgi:hypothetical protein